LLLQSRDNRSGAGEAIGEALQLNPRSAQAWYMLGQLQLGSFNFDAADASIAALRALDADHTLAHLLDAEAAIIQHRWADAQTALDQIDHPMPEAQALQCALLALQGKSALARDVFEAALHDRPGDARVAATTGRLLSLHRRYEDAERWLNDALAIDDTDHEQWSELGLMRWQAGLDADARTALRRASALNPFDRRAANSLRLLDDIDAWDSIDTGDVLIRWPPGIDALLAIAIAADVQHMHDRLERELQWTPSQQTVLEIHPDHEHFAVRVTGTPDVHTVAACTGPVIAMEPPRGGAPGIHAGPYDWGPVVQHELAHVAHLDISRSRVPLWFTEGAAVAHEPLPLDWSARELLARRWHAGSLLPFDDLSWAFVRPEHPEDRPLAYAQSAWFLLHLQDTWGPAIVGDILAALGRDVTLDNAFAHLTGQTPAAIWEDFIDQHATVDLQAWGLLHQITPSMLAMDDQSLRAAIDDEPQNPAPLLAWLHRTSDAATDDRTMLLQRLCALRPLDPWPRRELAQRHRDAGEPGAAADVLQELAHNRDTTPALLDDLAMTQRAAGRTESALLTMAHAVSMNPYDVPQRERAAALALEAGRLDLAQTHIEALVLLEPDESLHRKRLEALTRQR
ncbi:MAG: hypothetical protein MK074_09830, partial [Phycisphaerales bacterium]|nr:hypothetical protein [Phycisphaerales bacterium]